MLKLNLKPAQRMGTKMDATEAAADFFYGLFLGAAHAPSMVRVADDGLTFYVDVPYHGTHQINVQLINEPPMRVLHVAVCPAGRQKIQQRAVLDFWLDGQSTVSPYVIRRDLFGLIRLNIGHALGYDPFGVPADRWHIRPGLPTEPGV